MDVVAAVIGFFKSFFEPKKQAGRQEKGVNARRFFQARLARLKKSRKPVSKVVEEIRSCVVEVLEAKPSFTNQELLKHLQAKKVPQRVKDDFTELLNALDAGTYGRRHGNIKKTLVKKALKAFDNLADE